MRTSKEIFDRLRWDPGFDARWFKLGYEDHERGICEIAADQFDPHGDIPWHRVQYFRCGDVLVWDRRTGVDRLAELRQSPAGRSATPEPPPRPLRSRDALLAHLRRDPRRAVAWAPVQTVPEYPGFVREVCVRAPGAGEGGELEVEWCSYALDWMGDATRVSVTYGFETVDALLEYLARRFGTGVGELTPSAPPLPAGTPHVNAYPRSLVRVFQDAWRRLRADFADGVLLDGELRVVRRFDGF